MDGLSFVSSLVGSLAWPIVVTGLGVYAVANLDRFARALKGIKLKDIEVSFRDDIEELKEDALESNVTVFYPAAQLAKQHLLAVPDGDRLALVEAGNDIQGLLITWAKKQPPFPNNHQPLSILEHMKSTGLLSDYLFTLARRVLEIRNRAVHAPELGITSGEVVEFLGVAKSVKDRLNVMLEQAN
jgi:hypothetical protein